MTHINRREFLKNSAKGVAVASIPFFLKGFPGQALALPDQAIQLSLNDALNHFGLDQSMIQKIIATGLEKGGEYCDVFFQHGLNNVIVLEDKIVNRAYTNVDFGVGIRVIKGDQTGYSFTEDLNPKAMIQAAKTAANIANQQKSFNPVEFKFKKTPNYYPIKQSWEELSIDKKIPLLEYTNDVIFAADPHVVKAMVYMVDDTNYILQANSLGDISCDYRPMAQLVSMITAEKDGKRESDRGAIAGRFEFSEFSKPRIEKMATKAVSKTMELFTAVKPKAGEMEVVLAAGSSGILLHEAMGHPMEADFNRKKTSIFADKINKPVAEKFVSIVDDGTNMHSRGAINIDDECCESQNTTLIDKGKLVSYMHDRISAKHYGVKPTGNGRRESFRNPVLPRMRNTYMLPGPHKKEEIIKSVKNGIYAESFTNGQVFIGAGDFTFYVKSGYLIEDGKMTKPIKDINIIGNGPEVLGRINMVADDLKFSEMTWTCGKDGQSVPVSLGLPTVKVSSLTVGGKS